MLNCLRHWPVDRSWRCQFGVVFAGVCLLCIFGVTARAADTKGDLFFREKIEPVLKAQCYSCHSRQADEVQGGLRLDFKAGVLRGGDTGPAIVAGKSGKSLLIQAIRHEGDLVMPPKKPKLTDQTIADFVKWVEMGALIRAIANRPTRMIPSSRKLGSIGRFSHCGDLRFEKFPLRFQI